MGIEPVLLLFALLYLLFIWKAGKTFPIFYLFFFTYYLQYIFSTYLIYYFYDELRAEMEIGPKQYFDYAVPALISLFAGVWILNKDFDIRSAVAKINPIQAARLGFLLTGIGYGFDLLPALGIEELNSVVSFTSYLKYIGAFCFLFTNSKSMYVLTGLVFLHLTANAFRGGVFIDFFMWCTYLFCFISLKFKFRFWTRMLFIVIAVPILILIQSVKREYRRATWIEGKEGGIALFSELAKKESSKQQEYIQSEGVIGTVGRLSQGWHLGLTLKHVPKNEPFAEGEDMLGDLSGTILPRLIFTEKKTIGSQEKFLKYTGHRLRGSTSMTIGVLGDFYVNYGRWGSFVMLFIFGGLIALLLRYFMLRFVRLNPLHVVWIPYLLSYLSRANNDFYIVVNCMVKGFIIFLIINYIRVKLWPPVRLKVQRA